MLEGKFLDDAFPYALGYYNGRALGVFENGTYENMTHHHQYLFKLGYDNGVSDFCEMDILGESK